MQQAIVALKNGQCAIPCDTRKQQYPDCECGKANEAIKALTQALAEPAPEPVAWARRWHSDGEKPVKVKNENGRWAWPQQFKFLPITLGKCLPDDVPLYAAPPAQREALTQEMARLREELKATRLALQSDQIAVTIDDEILGTLLDDRCVCYKTSMSNCPVHQNGAEDKP